MSKHSVIFASGRLSHLCFIKAGNKGVFFTFPPRNDKSGEVNVLPQHVVIPSSSTSDQSFG